VRLGESFDAFHVDAVPVDDTVLLADEGVVQDGVEGACEALVRGADQDVTVLPSGMVAGSYDTWPPSAMYVGKVIPCT